MQNFVGRTVRSLFALTIGASLLTACTATEAPTTPTPGGTIPVQPNPVTTGAIALTISGLPFGTVGSVTVIGPNGFTRTLTSSSTLAELASGRYTINAERVRIASGANSGTYAPSMESQTIDVVAGPPASVTVAYAALAAVVDVKVTGLPTGIAASIKMTAPNGFESSVTASQLISPAVGGRWMLSASPVPNAGFTYTPTPAQIEGNVAAGDTLRFPVEYALSTGALAVAVTGLPAGNGTPVTVTGPTGFSRTLAGTTTLTDLAPGSYSVVATSVVLGGITFDPSPANQQITVTASLVAAPATVAYSAQVGNLTVTTSGLPVGASAQFTLAGNGITPRTIVADAVVDSLIPGNYTVTATPVLANGLTYAPTTTSATVAVTARATATTRFTYGVTTGALTVSSNGLPTGSTSDITVAGPNGFARNLTTSTTLSALTPGRYTVTARDVRTSLGTYVASPPTQVFDIVAGGTVSVAAITYAPSPAVIEVTVSGLLTGTAPSVTLTPPSGADIAISAAFTRITPATPGRWRLSATVLTVGGYTYVPTPLSRDSNVALGDTLRLPVQYTLTTGAIALAVTGLPTNALGAVTINGPSNFRTTATTTGTITGLTPGVYTITATNVTVGGLPYVPTPATQTVTVSASLVGAPAVVNYAVPGGRIAFDLTGLPVGVAPTFLLAGQNGTTVINGNATLSNTPIGTYTMTANTIIAGGVTYTPTPTTRTLNVNINTTSFASFSYAASGGSSTGRLAFAVTGLPTGGSPTFALTGANGTSTITGTATVDPVVAGTYTLTANNYSSSGTVYTASPGSQQITITAGATATATFVYSTGNNGGGGFNLQVENAYVTQATQRPDGTVSLVANRDALLRVFVTASTANTFRPDVRVRIYDGASLLQTVTIPAPESGVRTSSSEGTLSSTWNTLISAANVRPNMRIVADVDPASAVTETDRTDNVWPRGGTPQAISVTTVPPFNVRFVPVTVAGLTGVVTELNKEQFLTSTRRYMPVNSVVSDVRAPFTSSAPVLQSSDGNSAWLTVLSEMNALRATDGAPSTMHYYGVVKVTYNSGIAGYGYVPGRAAVGWDYLPSGDAVAVHEWGHNFSRPHTPCSVAGDDAYPYAGGTIGMWGWNSSSNILVSPSATDVMGYCSNQWISDWTWTKILDYRQTSGFQARAIGASTTGVSEGLLVWGRVVDGRVLLEPSFRVRAAISPAPANASHRVQLLDASGASLLDIPVNADRVDHESAHDERHFAVVVPWTATLEQSLARVRVRDVRQPLASSERASTTATMARTAMAVGDELALPDPQADIAPVNGSATSIRWNTRAFPMAMVRDAATGALMGFVRNSGDAVTTNGRRVEVVYSDGVRSVVRQ